MSPSLPLIAICAVALVALTVSLLQREQRGVRTPSTKPVALALIVVGLVVGAFVSYRVVFPPPPVAEAELRPGQGTLDVTIPAGMHQLLVHGPLGTGQGNFAVEVKEGGKLVDTYAGTLERSLQTRKVTRRVKGTVVVEHLEGRHDLPDALDGKSVSIAVTKADGAFTGPLVVSVIPAPPPELVILGISIALAAAGAVVDRRSRDAKKSHLGIGLAMYGAFALLLLESAHPLELKHLIGVVPMSALLGAAGGGLVRLVVGLFVKARPPSSGTSSGASSGTSSTVSSSGGGKTSAAAPA
jgi:hypothetical protein